MRTKSVAKQVTVEQLLKVQDLVTSKGEVGSWRPALSGLVSWLARLVGWMRCGHV
jgi:hypothetical protein